MRRETIVTIGMLAAPLLLGGGIAGVAWLTPAPAWQEVTGPPYAYDEANDPLGDRVVLYLKGTNGGELSIICGPRPGLRVNLFVVPIAPMMRPALTQEEIDAGKTLTRTLDVSEYVFDDPEPASISGKPHVWTVPPNQDRIATSGSPETFIRTLEGHDWFEASVAISPSSVIARKFRIKGLDQYMPKIIEWCPGVKDAVAEPLP